MPLYHRLFVDEDSSAVVMPEERFSWAEGACRRESQKIHFRNQGLDFDFQCQSVSPGATLCISARLRGAVRVRGEL